MPTRSVAVAATLLTICLAADLRARFEGRVEFAWKIALLDAAALPPSRAAMEWYYRRSGTITRAASMLNQWAVASSRAMKRVSGGSRSMRSVP